MTSTVDLPNMKPVAILYNGASRCWVKPWYAIHTVVSSKLMIGVIKLMQSLC